jgi:hypothetical protein
MFLFMNDDAMQSQSEHIKKQSAETPASPNSGSQTRLIIFVLVLMLAPNVLELFDPVSPHDIYQNVPNWYMLWAVLNETLPAISLIAFLFFRRKNILLVGLLMLLPISVINIILEATVLRPIQPIGVYSSHLVIIVLSLIILRSTWHRFSN